MFEATTLSRSDLNKITAVLVTLLFPVAFAFRCSPQCVLQSCWLSWGNIQQFYNNLVQFHLNTTDAISA